MKQAFPHPLALSAFRSLEERTNTVTHLLGVGFALGALWLLWPAFSESWQLGFGVSFFVGGMLLMYSFSTLYHWALPGVTKRILRKLDHIGIYVMIVCSYTPICVGVIGGIMGWSVFALLWLVVIGGTVYKSVAIDRLPRLSLALYLLMGWSGVFIAPQIFEKLSMLSLILLGVEGLAYTAGTYFFARDHRPFFHAVWHIFVLIGSLAHCGVVLALLFE